MLLINIVMVKFAERDLLQAKIQTGRLLLQALETQTGSALDPTHGNLAHAGFTLFFERNINKLLQAGDFSAALMISREGTRVFSFGSWDGAEEKTLSVSREALTTRKEAFDFYGSTWGVIWLAHKRINIAGPIPA